MRYTAGDVMGHPTRLLEWWYELPLRRNIRSFAWWRWLLFEDGQGWLRWGASERTAYPLWELEPPASYPVFPPLRRVAVAVRYRATWPLGFRDEDRRLHRAW